MDNSILKVYKTNQNQKLYNVNFANFKHAADKTVNYFQCLGVTENHTHSKQTRGWKTPDLFKRIYSTLPTPGIEG